MKKTLVFCLVSFLTLVLFVGHVSASDGSSLKEADISEIVTRMQKDGSSPQDIKQVVEKIKNGETLDADKAKGISTVITHDELNDIVKNGKSKTKAGNDKQGKTFEKIKRFNDGSYLKVKAEVEPELVTDDGAVTTLASNGKYYYVKVYGNSAWADASYRAKVYIDTHIGNDHIASVYSPEIHTAGSVYSEDRLRISRKYEIRSESISAKSYLYFKNTLTGNWSSRSYYLRLHAGDHINDPLGIYVSYTNGSSDYYY